MPAVSTIGQHGRWWLPATIGTSLFRFLLSVFLTFIGLTVVTFVIGRLIPIDPALAVVGDHASSEAYHAARVRMGLDLPIHLQYLKYLLSIFKGDLGTSVVTGQPVLDDLLTTFPATIELATIALAFGVGVGVPMGVVSAVKEGKWIDHIIRVVALLGYSAPIFWLGLVGLLVFYAQLGWVSGPGRLDMAYSDIVPQRTGLLLIDSILAGEFDVFANAVSHVLLPALLLGYLSLAYIARMTRSFMIDQLGQEYILAARAKGLSSLRIIWSEALGNIMVPLITVVALSYGNLLEGAVLTETVFAWPGLGMYMKNALFNADMNAVLGGTLVIGGVYICFNMLSDLCYPMFDPRARVTRG
jgi:peptide/nickel transport system permease protein